MDDFLNNTVPRREFLKVGAIAAGSTFALSSLLNGKALAETMKPATSKRLQEDMARLKQEIVDTLTPKDYSHLLGHVDGLSDNQLRQHFKLYENYINKTNLLNQLIRKADQEMLSGANPTYAPYREMLVELSYAHNGVVLHELYFGNLGHHGAPHKNLVAVIQGSFGSWENYLKHLMAAGKASRGWAITGFDMRDGHLRNYGLDQHNQWAPVHFYPILALDVYEHAYMIDFGTNRSQYLDVFVNNVNWEAVYNRLLFAVHHLMSGPAATD